MFVFRQVSLEECIMIYLLKKKKAYLLFSSTIMSVSICILRIAAFLGAQCSLSMTLGFRLMLHDFLIFCLCKWWCVLPKPVMLY